MPRQFFKRYLPDHTRLRKQKSLHFLGERLYDGNLWHLSRRSVAGGLGMGVFVAFIPVPGQMIIAAALSMWLRVNLPLAVAVVWITNPVTMPAIFFFTYKVGVWMLSIWPLSLIVELSPADDWLLTRIGAIGGPLLLGSLTVGVILGLVTYAAILFVWRLHIVSRLRQRRQRHIAAKAAKSAKATKSMGERA